MSRRYSSSSSSSGSQWSPGLESDEESLGELSPFIYPPSSTPPRPSLENIRTQRPRPDQNRFFPPNQPGQVKQEVQVPKLPPTFRPESGIKGDNSFQSRNVISLKQSNFEQTIMPMEKILIYFYNGTAVRNTRLEHAFSTAADSVRQPGYAFAAVDCGYERSICDYYMIYQTPVFKLFSNGFEVSTINKPDSFGPAEIQQFITMSPVLNKPRSEKGKDFMQNATAKKNQALYGQR